MSRKKHERSHRSTSRSRQRHARPTPGTRPPEPRVPRAFVDRVEEASMESFPASDPPGYYSGHA